MQYTFLGFSTAKIMEFELDMKDMAILRYFVDFRETGKMKAEMVDGENYYWVKYEAIVEEIPFIDLKKKAVMARMLKLRDLGILTHYTKRSSAGTYSFFGLGSKYIELISDTKIETPEVSQIKNDDKEGVRQKGQGYPSKRIGVSVKTYTPICPDIHPYPSGRTPNNPSTKDPSTKDPNIKNIKKNSEEIVGYLNTKVGCDYRSNNQQTLKLIKARLKENYTVDDFKVVIDKKKKEWTGTQYEQYLTPNTLFGSKFEQYLKQRVMPKQNNNPGQEKPPLRFNNFDGRDKTEEEEEDLEKRLLGWK
ncbi:conserved phage C-terminal domain-containing protein [Clostridium gasigenes]|uniref:conserved phage C-terminal domain-containing protein n=1 Tax=Clostridium gasigenes TaxID=94869 RepID=UPI0016259833|nr:conserved phage C-terminal domain-containing protein [Clostridium gasigenes]MBB6622549.1 conserved phage C-terminal domain-containing protein [Clostridium gasigenes]